MSSSIDWFTCPKCGGHASREQDNTTCEVIYSCSCGWKGESVEDEEVVEPKKTKKKGLKFTCPKCGGHQLGSVEQVIATYPITHIPANGNLDYDYHNIKDGGDGEVLAYQFMKCGFELTDENGNTITDCIKVPKWIMNQSKKK